MGDDGADALAALASELIGHVRAVAEARHEHASLVDAQGVVRDEEDRVEERDVAVARGRRVEVPVPTDRLGVDEDRVTGGDLLEIGLRARARRAAAAAVEDEHERVGDLWRIPVRDDERVGAVASRAR